MAGISINSKTGIKIKGKFGTYIVKEKIGEGGNGIVYTAKLIDGGKELPYKKSYAIKFLKVSSKDEHEKEKRVQRFIKEIKTVLSFLICTQNPGHIHSRQCQWDYSDL